MLLLMKPVTYFTVHEPPASPAVKADPIERAASLVFLKDGFNWGAFLLAPFWLVANRLWWMAAGYVFLVMLAGLVLWALGAHDAWQSLMVLGLNAIVGFEAHALKTRRLAEEGWALLGTVSGRGLAECERRFFEAWEPSRSEPPARPYSAGRGAPASAWREAIATRGLSLIRRKG